MPTFKAKFFDFGSQLVALAGPDLPYLVVKNMESPLISIRDQTASGVRTTSSSSSDFTFFKLPNEARGIEQLAFLTDRLLLGYLSEGIFYLVDFGQQ